MRPIMPNISTTNFPLIIVAGRSGAGKSTVLQVFEDTGYFTVDGLPAYLVSDILNVLNSKSLAQYKGLVIGIDTRQRDYFQLKSSILHTKIP